MGLAQSTQKSPWNISDTSRIFGLVWQQDRLERKTCSWMTTEHFAFKFCSQNFDPLQSVFSCQWLYHCAASFCKNAKMSAAHDILWCCVRNNIQHNKLEGHPNSSILWFLISWLQSYWLLSGICRASEVLSTYISFSLARGQTTKVMSSCSQKQSRTEVGIGVWKSMVDTKHHESDPGVKIWWL